MSGRFEVPHLADLVGCSVEVAATDSPGVVSVTARANDGDVVTLTWDEIAESVHVRWLQGDGERLAVERETASKVSISEEHGEVQFWLWSRSDGLAGLLVVRVGLRVTVSDAILRQ